MRRTRESGQRGASALLVAGSLLFLLGSAALAVDVSGFFGAARTSQTTADLACLAGAAELPDSTAAIEMAATYAKANWPEMGGATLTFITGESATLSDGTGNVVTFETNVGGDAGVMRVSAAEVQETRFAEVLGARSVTVTQEAHCGRSAVPGMAVVPFGALPSWDGVLQVESPCDTGNCRALDLPRSDINGSGNQFVRNLALGAEKTLEPGVNVVCTESVDVCDTLNMNQGVSAGQLADALVREGAGVEGRLRDLGAGGTTYETKGQRIIDAMTPEEIFGDAYDTWEEGDDVGTSYDAELHGPLTADQLFVDGPIPHCDSPRLIRVPIVVQVDWDPGEEFEIPSGNSQMVKVVGFYDAVIVDPDGVDDFGKGGSDNLTTASAKIWWPGPNAECANEEGEWIPWDEASVPADSVRLVSG